MTLQQLLKFKIFSSLLDLASATDYLEVVIDGLIIDATELVSLSSLRKRQCEDGKPEYIKLCGIWAS